MSLYLKSAEEICPAAQRQETARGSSRGERPEPFACNAVAFHKRSLRPGASLASLGASQHLLRLKVYHTML